ncbi:MAG: 30S ribosomal protein S13 [Candidatus Paceibacterota bacterium]
MRIAGITIPDNKRLEVGLTKVYGIGLAESEKILNDLSIDKAKKPKDVTEKEEAEIRKYIESNYLIEGDLRRQVSSNIKRQMDIRSYRGTRHSKKLPCRGQRTKTNSRTRRGNTRKTMGTGRRKTEKK